MFTDPQSVTINAVAIPLPRTSSGDNKGVYTSADGLVQETAVHSYGRRTRRSIRLQHSKVAPDPLISAQNIKFSMSCSLVVDVPPTGYTATEAKQVVVGLIAQLNASSGALITKLLGGES